MGTRTMEWVRWAIGGGLALGMVGCGGVVLETASDAAATDPPPRQGSPPSDGGVDVARRYRWVPAGGRETKYCSGHTATALGSDVLVVGGCVVGQEIVSALRYDTAQDRFEIVDASPWNRISHAAVRVADGRAVVIGGNGPGGWDLLATVVRFDPVASAWQAAPPMAEARARHTATLLADGRVLVAGGTVAFGAHGGDIGTDAVEVFDPASPGWSPAASLTEPRTGHAAVALPDGRVFVLGGGETGQTTAEIFDPAAGGWSAVPPWTEPSSTPTATLLAGGQVLVVAGFSAAVFDPATLAWGPTIALEIPRGAHMAAQRLDGRVVIAGGTAPPPAGVEPSAEEPVDVFDPEQARFEPTAPSAGYYSRDTLTRLADGALLAVGASGAELYVH